MSYARWTTNRTSGHKYQKVAKQYNEPELKMLQLVADLQREGLVRSFRTNNPIIIGSDVNGRAIWAIPDVELVTNTHPSSLIIIRVNGTTWHPEGDEGAAEQKRLLEKLHYMVVDVPIDGKEDWGQIRKDIIIAIS